QSVAPSYRSPFPTRRSSDLIPRRVEALQADETAAELHVRVVRVLEPAIERPLGRVRALLPPVQRRMSVREAKVDLAVGRELRCRSEEHTSELQSRENLVCRL